MSFAAERNSLETLSGGSGEAVNQKLSFVAFSSRKGPADRGDRAAPKRSAQGWVSRRLAETRLQHILLFPWLHGSLCPAVSQSLSLPSTGMSPIKAPRGICSLGWSVQQCRAGSEQQLINRLSETEFDHTSFVRWDVEGSHCCHEDVLVLLCKRSSSRLNPSAELHWQILPAASRVRKTLGSSEFAHR